MLSTLFGCGMVARAEDAGLIASDSAALDATPDGAETTVEDAGPCGLLNPYQHCCGSALCNGSCTPDGGCECYGIMGGCKAPLLCCDFPGCSAKEVCP